MKKIPDQRIEKIVAEHPEFTPDACVFVSESVNHTVTKLAQLRHVSAMELLCGARELARVKFGAAAPGVLDKWGIRRASDFGKLVYLMIDAGILGASDGDKPEDFDVDFSFSQLPVYKISGTLPLLD